MKPVELLLPKEANETKHARLLTMLLFLLSVLPSVASL